MHGPSQINEVLLYLETKENGTFVVMMLIFLIHFKKTSFNDTVFIELKTS